VDRGEGAQVEASVTVWYNVCIRAFERTPFGWVGLSMHAPMSW